MSGSPSKGRRGRLVAVQTVRIVVCDKCGTEGGTERYVVSFPAGGRRTFDLCGSCSEPLNELAALLDKLGERGPKKHQQPVLTQEQLEAQVRKARKKPAKKAPAAPKTRAGRRS